MAGTHRLKIVAVPGRFAVCRLLSDAQIPAWANAGHFVSVTRTPDELSIVCAEASVPAGVQCERGYAGIRVAGTLAPEMVGVLASMAGPLADAGIPILAIGTYDTDYVLVRADDLARAMEALRGAGHEA